ncbi:MAG: GNAT family N-acetyltransferase [Angelakisella sp.]
MDLFGMRKAAKDDIDKIVEIYNSNDKFLSNHLGVTTVDAQFIRNEMEEMEAVGFLSCVIFDAETDNIVGVLDYKPDATVYLSIVMLNSKFQGKGVGSSVYKFFEEAMMQSEKQSIRIDVVNEYAGNVVEFWHKQGFLPQKEVQLVWAGKKSNALVMIKHLV